MFTFASRHAITVILPFHFQQLIIILLVLFVHVEAITEVFDGARVGERHLEAEFLLGLDDVGPGGVVSLQDAPLSQDALGRVLPGTVGGQLDVHLQTARLEGAVGAATIPRDVKPPEGRDVHLLHVALEAEVAAEAPPAEGAEGVFGAVVGVSVGG